jgi:hypothetical protein
MIDWSRDLLRGREIASEGPDFGRNRRSSAESGCLAEQGGHAEVADAASESVSATLRAAHGRGDDANGLAEKEHVPAPRTAVARETQMHYFSAGLWWAFDRNRSAQWQPFRSIALGLHSGVAFADHS